MESVHESKETDGLLDRQKAYSSYQGKSMHNVTVGGSSLPEDHVSGRDHGRMFLHHGANNIRRRFDTWAYLKASLSSVFHTLAYMQTGKCVMTMVGIYVSIILIYGAVWTVIGVECPECNLDIHNFLEGCLFSLESLATIGYGTESSDIFFGDCYSAALTLLLEICTKLFVDSMVLGIIYVRLARPSLRAGAFLVSDFAVLRRVNGKLYFMCQFIDTKKQQLLSSTLRLYSVHKPAVQDTTACPFRTNQLKVAYPEFDYIPMLMYLPQLIVHEINADSPLMPTQEFIHTNTLQFMSEAESELADGLTVQQRVENKAVDSYLRDRDFEIFGLVDGTDPISGMPTQLRFSYRHRRGELKWDLAFVSCVSEDPETGAPIIDFNAFQNTVACPSNIHFDDSRKIPDIFDCLA